MKKKIASIILLLCLMIISGCRSTNGNPTTLKQSDQSSNTSKTNDKSVTPTLFIHGYSGTVNSFRGMIHRLENQQFAQKEMVITVQSDNSLQVDGELSNAKTNPMIQVLFTDNKNNEWNQTEWIYTVLKYLKAHDVKQVNIVGHSMGGVSAFRFLTTYGGAPDSPIIRKLVAIGSPFNDFIDTSDLQSEDDLFQKGPSQESARYIDFKNGIDNVPASVSILLLAGKLDTKTFNDGTVPVTSALSIYSLLQENGNPIRQEIFTGPDAQHSLLHENTAVDHQIVQFLWEKNQGF